MPIDIKKGNQIFGPHTIEDLRAFVNSGEVALTDTVIKESGETLSVEDFLAQPTPLKLRLSIPVVPTASAAQVRQLPLSPPPLPPATVYHRPAVSRESEPVVESAGVFPWVAAVIGVACFIVNLKIAKASAGAAPPGYIFGMAFGQTIMIPLVVLAINAARKKGRTARGLSIGLLIGFALQLAMSINQTPGAAGQDMVVSSTIGSVQPAPSTPAAPLPRPAPVASGGVSSSSPVGWLGGMDAAKRKASAEQKQILLLYWGGDSSCPWAPVFNRTIVGNRPLLARLEEDYVLVKIMYPPKISAQPSEAEFDAFVKADKFRLAVVETQALPAMAIVSADGLSATKVEIENAMSAKNDMERFVLKALASASKQKPRKIKL